MTDQQAKDITVARLLHVPQDFVRLIQAMLQGHTRVTVTAYDSVQNSVMVRCSIDRDTWGKERLHLMWEYARQWEPGISPSLEAI